MVVTLLGWRRRRFTRFAIGVIWSEMVSGPGRPLAYFPVKK